MNDARPRFRPISTLLFAALCVAGTAGAHEGHHHDALGTVKAVDAAQLDLETKEGTLESFVLTDKTVYQRGDAAATHHDVAVGDRAVVTYEKKDGKNVAVQVKLGVKKTESASAARNACCASEAEGAAGTESRP